MNLFSINFDDLSVISIADVSLMDLDFVDMVLLYIVMVTLIKGVIQGCPKLKEF